VGCAKVGAPLPPVVKIPEPVTNLQLVQVGSERVEIIFPIVDSDVRLVEVLRECSGGEVSLDSEPLARIEVTELPAGVRTGTRVFSESMQPMYGCVYAVRLESSSRQRSALSNVVKTLQVSVAEAPTNLESRIMEDGVELTWTPPAQNEDGSSPANFSGYLVNSEHRSSEPRFRDSEFAFGESETYRVQAISRDGNPLVLSRPSVALTVVPEDVFPPEAPVKLTAVAVGNSVQLIWDANAESDLSGYAVYRRTTGKEFKRVSPLVAVNRFLDESITVDTLYYYVVAAIDAAGNEGPYSEVVTLTVNP
jgi:hypothetical protein